MDSLDTRKTWTMIKIEADGKKLHHILQKNGQIKIFKDSLFLESPIQCVQIIVEHGQLQL